MESSEEAEASDIVIVLGCLCYGIVVNIGKGRIREDEEIGVFYGLYGG
jgi:hypothetical protein